MNKPPDPIPCSVCGKPATTLVHVSDVVVEPRCDEHKSLKSR